MGLHHPEQAFFPGRSRADAERLEVGDVLWVQGGAAALEQIQISEGTMMLEGAAEIPRTAKAGLALLIFAGVVLLAALHLVPIARSEEHTSELQSLMRISYAVFSLKKKIQTQLT